MLVNCDIGERGANHPVDQELMEKIGLANIACGGHAGDLASIQAFCSLAEKKNVLVAAHLSYPDRKNFGRISMDMDWEALSYSLKQQLVLMRSVYPVNRVKLHGALYNDCNVNEILAAQVASWLKNEGCTIIITPFDSALADASKALGLEVFAEAFAERRYSRDPSSGRLVLVNRSKEYASIHDIEGALKHANQIINENKVELFLDDSGILLKEITNIEAKTICIHSDSPISLELAQRLSN